MITSAQNDQLTTIRRLHRKRDRSRSGLFIAEGEDLVDAASAAGWEPEALLVAGVDVDPTLLASVSTLGSGTRAIGVYRQRWSKPGGRISIYLHGLHDPGNVGGVIRSAHAFADGPAILGPGCADPYSPKAVRASMGSVFARPPARASWAELSGHRLALDPRAPTTLGEAELEPPMVIGVGAERDGLPESLLGDAEVRARIATAPDGPESLNAAMAATIALYECARGVNRMADRG